MTGAVKSLQFPTFARFASKVVGKQTITESPESYVHGHIDVVMELGGRPVVETTLPGGRYVSSHRTVHPPVIKLATHGH